MPDSSSSRCLFCRSRCHAVSPAPRKWCPSSTWTSPALSSFPLCSWPSAAAVDPEPTMSKVGFLWHLLATWHVNKKYRHLEVDNTSRCRPIFSYKHLCCFFNSERGSLSFAFLFLCCSQKKEIQGGCTDLPSHSTIKLIYNYMLF